MTALIENRKAKYDYEILEKYEGGIELQGFEVKSLKGKRGKLEGAHAVVRRGEVYLVGAHIPPYQPANTPSDYDPYRNRKILLTRKEINSLAGKGGAKGLTLIPLSLHVKGRRIKISLAVVRGIKKHDKREIIKKRESDRSIKKIMGNQ